jgi:plastocyanin
MNRAPLITTAAALAASLALAAPAALAGSAAATPLTGTVGPGFTIKLANKAGVKVKKLKPGLYKITVKDKSPSHNFHIFGPGVKNVVTTVPFVGTKTVTVKLKKGTYTYQCDPHAAVGMKATFKVA